MDAQKSIGTATHLTAFIASKWRILLASLARPLPSCLPLSRYPLARVLMLSLALIATSRRELRASRDGLLDRRLCNNPRHRHHRRHDDLRRPGLPHRRPSHPRRRRQFLLQRRRGVEHRQQRLDERHHVDVEFLKHEYGQGQRGAGWRARVALDPRGRARGARERGDGRGGCSLGFLQVRPAVLATPLVGGPDRVCSL